MTPLVRVFRRSGVFKGEHVGSPLQCAYSLCKNGYGFSC